MKKNKNIEIFYYSKNKEFEYYNKLINCYMIKKTIILLDEIHLFFLKKMQQSLKNIFNCDINVQLNKVLVYTDTKLISSTNTKYSINKIELKNNLGIAFISFPLKVTTLMINSLLKNNSAHSESYKKIKQLTKTDIFMQKKFLNIVKEAYEHSWENFCFSEKHHAFFKNKSKVQYYPIHNKKNKLQIHIVFSFTLNSIQIKLIIIIPYYTFKNINNYLSFRKNTKLNNSNISNINILSIIENVTLNLSIRSVEKIIPLNNIRKINVGDVIPINNPEEVIIHVEKIPIFSGNYGIKNEKIVIQVNNIIK